MTKPPKRRISVQKLVQSLKLARMNEGFEDTRYIEGSGVFYAGLALAGYLNHLTPNRCVLMGASEVGYLQSLPQDEAIRHASQFLSRGLGCVLATSEEWVPEWFLELANQEKVGIYYSTSLDGRGLQPFVSDFLRDHLAPRQTVHGVMMDVSGIGVLLLGASGIGKSECALELIKKGHRLVADDAVVLKRLSDRLVMAEPKEALKHAMELRGIGLIDVRALFGMGAISESKQVELVIRLETGDPSVSYERLGIETKTYDVAGVPVPYMLIPVIEGKNLSILIEVAAMNQHLRNLGVHSALELTNQVQKRLEQKIAAQAKGAAKPS